jgi:hypothetical protein
MGLQLVFHKGGANIEGIAEQGTEKSIWIQDRRDIKRVDKI